MCCLNISAEDIIFLLLGSENFSERDSLSIKQIYDFSEELSNYLPGVVFFQLGENDILRVVNKYNDVLEWDDEKREIKPRKRANYFMNCINFTYPENVFIIMRSLADFHVLNYVQNKKTESFLSFLISSKTGVEKYALSRAE